MATKEVACSGNGNADYRKNAWIPCVIIAFVISEATLLYIYVYMNYIEIYDVTTI